MKQDFLSDFFDPFHDLLTEAQIFCAHKDAKDYFYYRTEFTIKQALDSAILSQIDEVQLIKQDLTRYADTLLEKLEGFEEYEWCKRVKDQTRKLYQELFEMQMKMEKLDK